MFASAATVAVGVSVFPVAAKAVSELHRTVFNLSDALARQGESVPAEKGAGERLARQRAAGVDGTIDGGEPAYMGKVPSRATAGDKRKSYEVKKGSALSSRGILDDILAKVPSQANGTDSYKRIARPQPSRQPGFGNQSFTP
jgi:hypothetical protein